MSNNDNSGPKFLFSTQPEIIRLNQKDEEYQYQLNQQFLDAVEVFVPHIISYRFLNKHTETVKFISSLLYYGLTTLTRRQTLGEEFSNIAQYKESDFIEEGVLITKKRRIIFYLLTTCAQFLLKKLIKNRYNAYRESAIVAGQSTKYEDIIKQSNNQSSNEKSYQQLLQIIMRNLPDYDSVIEKIFKVHLILFFVQGKFLQISKRVADIQYIHTKKPQDHQLSYKKVGYFLIFQLFCEFARFIYRIYKDRQRMNLKLAKFLQEGPKSSYEKDDFSEQQQQLLKNQKLNEQNTEESAICGLCFDKRENSTVTPCGHLFCWKCIIKSCSIKPECPSCRQPCKPQKVVQLRNFA